MSTLIRCVATPSKLLRNDFRFRACLLQRYARFEARHDLYAYHPGSGAPVFPIRVQNQRSEDVRVFVVGSHGLRQYADDRDAASIQSDLSSYNLPVGVKTTAPASVGDNHDIVAPCGSFLVEKVAAENGLNAEGWQPVRTYEEPGKAFSGGSTALKVETHPIHPSVAGNLLEGLAV